MNYFINEYSYSFLKKPFIEIIQKDKGQGQVTVEDTGSYALLLMHINNKKYGKNYDKTEQSNYIITGN